jgi:hypothetical protein
MYVAKSHSPFLSDGHPLTPVSGTTASLRIQRMCVGVVVEAGQESSCATRFVANGEMWLTIHFCGKGGEGHEGCVKKK